MFGEIYKGRKVFVTGQTGFKGSWLCAWLLSLGAKVAGYANGIPTNPSNFEALHLSDKIIDYRGDIRDRNTLAQALNEFRPEVIFHLAAQPLVRQSYADPVTTFETNMLGVMNILEISRNAPSVKSIIIITSDKCYRNMEWVWGYRETDKLGGADPYSASKGCAELIAHSYFDCYFKVGAGCGTARAGNVIGGGDWAADRIMPDCARAWTENRPVAIRNPDSTRPWQFVLEPLSGYLWQGACLIEPKLCETGYNFRGQSYNFGPPAEMNMSVGEVAFALSTRWPGFLISMAKPQTTAKQESGLLKLCCDKALAELRWHSTLQFDETIRYTAEWYARYHAESPTPDMWDFTQGQIAAYCNAACERGLTWSKI